MTPAQHPLPIAGWRDLDPEARIAKVLNQRELPVIFNISALPGEADRSKLVVVKLPYAADNREWLKNGRRSKPELSKDRDKWKIPAAWYNGTVARCLLRYDRCYLIQRRNRMEICAPACRNAHSFDCECSCEGLNHGCGHGENWHNVSEAFSFRWVAGPATCRLLEVEKTSPRWAARYQDYLEREAERRALTDGWTMAA